jgi:hypothetical protein
MHKPRFFREKQAWAVVILALLLDAGLLFGFLGYINSCSTAKPVSESLSVESSPTALLGLPKPTWTPDSTGLLVSEPTITPTPLFFEGLIAYGTSFNGLSLEAYRFGYGDSVRIIIGGIHGRYEWNTVELVSDTLAYFQKHQAIVPSDVTLYIIPCANPDGCAAGTDAVIARMNGNGVDLNRNWDYHHQVTATHGTRPVKAGEYPFSEPETRYLRDFILQNEAELAIFYHSAGGVIFSSVDREHSVTYELAEMMSRVTGYRHQKEGIPRQVGTGDAIDWLSTQGIAAVEIELTTHEKVNEEEWQRNLNGILAFLNWSIPEVSPEVPWDDYEGE